MFKAITLSLLAVVLVLVYTSMQEVPPSTQKSSGSLNNDVYRDLKLNR